MEYEMKWLGLPAFILCPVVQEWRQICKVSVLLVCNAFQISNKTDITNFYKHFATWRSPHYLLVIAFSH